MNSEFESFLQGSQKIYCAAYPVPPSRKIQEIEDSIKVPVQQKQSLIVEQLNSQADLLHVLRIELLDEGCERLIFVCDEKLEAVEGLQDGYFHLPKSSLVTPLFVVFWENKEHPATLVAPHKVAIKLHQQLEQSLLEQGTNRFKLMHEL